MSVRGSLTNVVGADEEDAMLILLLKLEPDQCFLKTIGALREALSARPARQGRASLRLFVSRWPVLFCLQLKRWRSQSSLARRHFVGVDFANGDEIVAASLRLKSCLSLDSTTGS